MIIAKPTERPSLRRAGGGSPVETVALNEKPGGGAEPCAGDRTTDEQVARTERQLS